MSNDGGDLNLASLPTDTLLIIFSFCGPELWPVISQVCHRFYVILGPNSFLWEQISRTLLIVNQASHIFQSKLYGSLSGREKCRIYKNWRKGACVVKPIATIVERHLLPWLILECDLLWIGAGSHIRAYARTPPATFSYKPHVSKNSPRGCRPLLNLVSSSGDVGRFVVKDGIVVAGDTDGSLLVWRASSGKLQFKVPQCHSSEISSVGLHKNLIVSGSRDRTVKVWQYSWRNLREVHEINVEDRVLSLDIDPSGSVLCTGTGGHFNVAPSQLYDLSTGALISRLRKHFRDGEGVYDVHFESPNEVLTADFNSALRLWDLRTETNVCVWEDPHDSAVNCIASDNNVTMMTATATHGGIRLWDKRQRRCAQLYFVRPDLRSPVYSLDFDSSELFAALDTSVLGLDFSGANDKPSNGGLAVYSCN